MGSFVQKLRAAATRSYAWAKAHKIWSAVIIVVVLGGGYLAYAHYTSNASANQYVLVPVTRGPLVVTVTGSGQVAANQSIDLAPKASGTVTSVNVKAGDTVAAGDLIASVDDTDAEKTLRDSETDLTSAQISYQQSVTSSETDTAKASDDAYAAAGTALADAPGILKDLDSALHDTSTVPGETSRINKDAYADLLVSANGPALSAAADADYETALAAYQKALALSSSVSNSSSGADIQNLIATTYAAMSDISQAATATHNLVSLVNDRLNADDSTIPASFSSIVTTSASDETKADSDASSALSARDTLNASLATLQDASSTTLDIQSAQLALTKAENAVQDAKDNLADYFVTAPFAGTIAKVDVQTFDQASSGTTVATLVTNDQYADLSLNEVDAAKVADGQKAQLTFDAIDGLTLSGTVTEVDSLGTVTQGVVTYDVQISFDSQDARVKPGMTVNATITTDSANDALIVPSSAVTTIGNQSFIQVATGGAANTTASTTGFGGYGHSGSSTGAFASSTGRGGFGTSSSTGRYGMGSSTGMFASSTGMGGFAGRAAPTETVDASTVTVTRVPVVVGLSNDTQTQITSGVTEGELVVESTKTGTAASAASATTARTGTASVGGARAGGGFGAGRSPFGG